MPVEFIVEITELESLDNIPLDEAKDKLRAMVAQTMVKLFDENITQFNTHPDFPLDGVNQYAQINGLKLKHIASELVSNSMDALLSIEDGFVRIYTSTPIITLILKKSNETIDFIISDNGSGFSQEFIDNLQSNQVVSTKNVNEALMGGAGSGVKQLIRTANQIGLHYEFFNNPSGGAQVCLSIAREKLLTPSAYENQRVEQRLKRIATFKPNPDFQIIDGKFIPKIFVEEQSGLVKPYHTDSENFDIDNIQEINDSSTNQNSYNIVDKNNEYKKTVRSIKERHDDSFNAMHAKTFKPKFP